MNNMDWTIEELSMVKDFEFASSKEAMKYADEISKIAKEEKYLPDIHFHYGRIVNVKINKSTGTSPGDEDIRLANQTTRSV